MWTARPSKCVGTKYWTWMWNTKKNGAEKVGVALQKRANWSFAQNGSPIFDKRMWLHVAFLTIWLAQNGLHFAEDICPCVVIDDRLILLIDTSWKHEIYEIIYITSYPLITSQEIWSRNVNTGHVTRVFLQLTLQKSAPFYAYFLKFIGYYNFKMLLTESSGLIDQWGKVL